MANPPKFVQLECDKTHVYHFKCLKSYILDNNLRTKNVCPQCTGKVPIQSVTRYKSAIVPTVDDDIIVKKHASITKKRESIAKTRIVSTTADSSIYFDEKAMRFKKNLNNSFNYNDSLNSS